MTAVPSPPPHTHADLDRLTVGCPGCIALNRAEMARRAANEAALAAIEAAIGSDGGAP